MALFTTVIANTYLLIPLIWIKVLSIIILGLTSVALGL